MVYSLFSIKYIYLQHQHGNTGRNYFYTILPELRVLCHKQVSTTREIYAHQITEHQAKIAQQIPEIYKRPNVKKEA